MEVIKRENHLDKRNQIQWPRKKQSATKIKSRSFVQDLLGNQEAVILNKREEGAEGDRDNEDDDSGIHFDFEKGHLNQIIGIKSSDRVKTTSQFPLKKKPSLS